MEKLGQGGYRAVYQVQPEPNDGSEYAMKVEQKIVNRKHSTFNIEVLLKPMNDDALCSDSHEKIIPNGLQ